MLEACAEVIVVQEKYHPSVYSRRSRYMAERSDLVICALCFLAGTIAGVMLMCLLQAGRTGNVDMEGM